MITTPEGIQKLMGETREELIARVCSVNVLIRRERAEAGREADSHRSAQYAAEREADQAREALKPLQYRMMSAERRLDKLETVLDVLRATGSIDEKTADILYRVIRDDDNCC